MEGPEDAPPLVLLHALATCRDLWLPQMPAWATQFRVIRIDLPGHGESPLMDGAATLAGFADEVARVLDDLDIRRAALVGLSLGGMVAQAFALKFPDFWARYHNFGPCRIDLSHIDSNRLIIHVPGYDYLHFVGAGWIESIFLSLGKKDIHVRNNCPVGQACVPEVKWDATWH